MTSKKLVSLFLALLCAFCAFEPALSESLTSAEKEAKYQAAVLELETYLENGGETGSPAAIANEFDELRGYRQSRGFCNYAQALAKIANGEFDRELDRKLDLLSINQPFQEYLEEIGKNGASSIGPVRDLMTYAMGRKAEQEGQREEAIAQYRQCIGFFDTAVRYESLMEIEDETAYIKALSMYDAGNYAGAYQTFASLNGYEESGEMMELIISKLGYVPANENDNPESVKGLKAQAQPTQVTLTWNRAAHATEYEAAWRESGTSVWTVFRTVTGTSVIINGLKADTAYDFQVTAVAGKVRTQGAELTGVRTAAPTPTPLALKMVTGLRVTNAGSTEMTLSWNASAYAEGYEVAYRIGNSGTWTVFRTVTDTSVTVTGLSADTAYDFRLIAVNGGTRSPVAVLSGQRTAAPTPFVLQPASSLRVTGFGYNEITLAWTGAAYAEQYEVAYRISGTGNWMTFRFVRDTSVTVTGLWADTEYDFSVTAVTLTVRSQSVFLERQRTLTPTPTPLVLQKVTNLRVTSTGTTEMTLSWSAAANAKSYEVSYRTHGSGSWKAYQTVSGTSVTVRGLSANTSYDFRVIAVSGGTRSPEAVLSGQRTAAPTATPAPRYEKGSTVFFGHYPQGASGKDSTPIEWIVLEMDKANRKALVISRYGLDAKPYNDSNSAVTWEKCSLRKWLNGEFFKKAFSAAEQKFILTTKVENGKNQGNSKWKTDGGKSTQDKIFLLSYAEANKYFGVNYFSNGRSQAAPTAYAVSHGAYVNNNKIAEGASAGWWWLRSPGGYQSNAAFVFSDGSLYYNYVNNDGGCVRPALWIDLASDIF